MKSIAIGVLALSTLGTTLKSVMHDNFNALMTLQTYAASAEQFADPENRRVIQKQLDVLAQLKHVIPQTLKGQEPGRAAIGAVFSDYVRELQADFRGGSTGVFTRRKVQTMTGLCMSCHTELRSEQSYVDTQNKVESLSLPPRPQGSLTRHWQFTRTCCRLHPRAFPGTASCPRPCARP